MLSTKFKLTEISNTNIVAAKKNFYHTKLKITSPITRMLKKALCGYTIT